jgi:hypothetical protein
MAPGNIKQVWIMIGKINGLSGSNFPVCSAIIVPFEINFLVNKPFPLPGIVDF